IVAMVVSNKKIAVYGLIAATAAASTAATAAASTAATARHTAATARHGRRITAVVPAVSMMPRADVLGSHYCSCQHYCCEQGNNNCCEYCFCIHLNRKKIYNIYQVLQYSSKNYHNEIGCKKIGKLFITLLFLIIKV